MLSLERICSPYDTLYLPEFYYPLELFHSLIIIILHCIQPTPISRPRRNIVDTTRSRRQLLYYTFYVLLLSSSQNGSICSFLVPLHSQFCSLLLFAIIGPPLSPNSGTKPIFLLHQATCTIVTALGTYFSSLPTSKA